MVEGGNGVLGRWLSSQCPSWPSECKRAATCSTAHSGRRPCQWPQARAELLFALPPADILLGAIGYDTDGMRMVLIDPGTLPVIPTSPTRKRFHPFDEAAYQQRNLVEPVFCRLTDWRRIAIGYDNLGDNFSSAVAIAAIIVWWT